MSVDIHAMPASDARAAYAASGFTVASTTQPALRYLSPAERNALDPEDMSDEGQLARRTGLSAEGGTPQLRFELERSGLVAITLAGVYANSAAYAALQSAGGASAPAIESADRATTTLLFRAPPTADVVRRRLHLDLMIDAFRPSGDQSNTLAVPHAGCLERWINVGGAIPQLPVELETLLRADAAVSETDVVVWFEQHYRACKKSERGLTRDEVFHAFLAANNYTPSDFDVHALSRAVRFCTFFSEKRDKHGIKWMIARTDKPLASLSGVSVETLDPVELASFKAWRASREMSKERRAERAAFAAARKAKLEEQAHIAARFGTVEVRDDLARQDAGANFFQYFSIAEPKRKTACDAMALEYRALDVRQSTPAWWTISPPGTPHAERYRALVAARNEGAL